MLRPEDRVGTLLADKYRLETLLAQGGMGVVYAARHEHTGRAVAVKLLRPELSTRLDIVRRVSAEARICVEASHPNVVEVLDAGADERGVPFVVLERLYGRSLDAVLDTPLERLATAQAVVPIVNALVRLHEGGIVHRDIKPSNIFLSRERGGLLTPKLLDFGVAKALEGAGSTLSSVALGTPAYMAPEQALGIGAAGPASDVWSVAVVIVRCLTGKLPFDGDGDRFARLRQGLDPSGFPELPPALFDVLRSALRFDPAERVRDMRRLRADLLAAFAAIDADAPWPDERTVGYADGESALFERVDLEAALAGEPSPATAPLGRPTHLETRTLEPAATNARAVTPTSARARFALGASLGLVAIAGWAAYRNAAPHDPREMDEPRAVIGAAAQPAVIGAAAQPTTQAALQGVRDVGAARDGAGSAATNGDSGPRATANARTQSEDASDSDFARAASDEDRSQPRRRSAQPGAATPERSERPRRDAQRATRRATRVRTEATNARAPSAATPSAPAQNASSAPAAPSQTPSGAKAVGANRAPIIE